MTVDFGFAKSPAYRVAYLGWTGPWNEKKIQAQFEKVERAVKRAGGRTGRWIFREPGERKWEAAIEVKGSIRPEGGVRLKTLKAAPIAHVVFDPEQVSPRVIYHGLSDWLRWRRREKEIRSVVSTREVYNGNPWREPSAWKKTDVQFVVRR